MRRREMLEIITEAIDNGQSFSWTTASLVSERVLDAIERAGMRPPNVQVQKVRPPGFSFGAGCSMSCNCADCNPQFLVQEWEKDR